MIDIARELYEKAKREYGDRPYRKVELVRLIVRERKININTAYHEIRSLVFAGYLEEQSDGRVVFNIPKED